MLHFLSTVRQSMLSCRRRQPIPQDFTYALSQNNLTVSSLIAHLQPPVPPSPSQIWLESANEAEAPHPDVLPFLGPALSGASDKDRTPYIPSHFPAFPSKHTYKSTPEFTEREQDPRAVRERATEEGRLGEEALRRLIGAGKVGIDRRNVLLRGKGVDEPRQKLENMWMRTMLAVSEQEERQENSLGLDAGHQAGQTTSDRHGPRDGLEKLEVGALVNWEKTYWRVDAAGHNSRSRRRNDTAKKDKASLKDGAKMPL